MNTPQEFEFSFQKLQTYRNCLNVVRFSSGITITDRLAIRESIDLIDDTLMVLNTKHKRAQEEFEELKKLKKYHEDDKELIKILKAKNDILEKIDKERVKISPKLITIAYDFRQPEDMKNTVTAHFFEIENIFIQTSK